MDNKNIIKNCSNCCHSKKSLNGEYYRYCKLAQSFCSTVKRFKNPYCDVNFSGWVENPKPRSLRQVIYDIFWR